MQDDKQKTLLNEHEKKETKDTPKNQPITKEATDKKLKNKAPPTLHLTPTKAFAKPTEISTLLTTSEGKQIPPKSKTPCQSPRSPRSPGLMRQFQAVKTGIQFVNHLKPS